MGALDSLLSEGWRRYFAEIEGKAFKDLQVSIGVWTNVAGWGARVSKCAQVYMFYSESSKESHVVYSGLVQVLKVHSFW